MSQSKAVVLEKRNKKITVLTSDGAFQTLRYKGDVEIGEDIQLPNQSYVPLWRIGTSIAAVFLLTFMGIFGWGVFQPRTAVAMISLDINPSLQLTLDQKGEVLELESLNSDADQLITGLSLKGKAWGEALNEIIQKSVALNYLTEEQRWIVVGYSAIESEKKLPDESINTEGITKKVQEAVSEQGLTPTVAVYELTSEQQKQAHDTGLSLGEYALVDTAQKAGVEVNPKAVKEKDQRERLLDTPEIQEQLRKDNRLLEGINASFEQNNKGNTAIQNSIDQNNNSKDKKDNTPGGNQEKNNENQNDNSKNDSKDNDKSRENKDLGNQGKAQERSMNKDSIDKSKVIEKSNNKKDDAVPKGNTQGNSKENNSKVDDKDNKIQDKDSSTKQGGTQSQTRYNWDFRTIFRLSYIQRG